jgi:2-amino-4-hydroxy-6-hydroxymethyldihydropteridine diphosphokinase
MNNAALLLGSNMGDREINLERACNEINDGLGKIIQRSSVYETEPWGNTEQDCFLNMVVIVNSSMEAEQMMEHIISIEEKLGRVRTKKWEPRIIDIDILFYDDEIISKKNLVVPHPDLHLRKFTLMPLAEVMPAYIHPVLKKSMAELLHEIKDPLDVKKISVS